ncbi:MAG: metallophosphoesterase family protein [Actinomycetota bacterium]
MTNAWPEGLEADIALSCWVIEAARSKALEVRGHRDKATTAAERARILAQACAARNVGLKPAWVAPHAAWMANLAGTREETGAFGWFVLQRIGAYVEAHVPDLLPDADRERLLELGASDQAEVATAIATDGLPEVPPPEWPSAPPTEAPGRPIARIGLIGDTHVGTARGDKLAPAIVRGVNAAGVDMSVVVGDVTQNGSPEFYERAAAILQGLEQPWAATLGNHDLWDAMWTDGTGAAGADRFRGALGHDPSGVYESAGVRVIVVSSADPTPSPFPPFDLVGGTFTNERSETLPGGRISEETADWLASIGPYDGPTFVFLHHPAHPYMGFPPLVFGLDERSTRILADLVERAGVWGVVCGHTHRARRDEIAGVPLLEVPASKDWPYGFGLLDVADEGWAVNLRRIDDDDLVAELSVDAGLVFRRYARGEERDRAFSIRR